MSIEDRVSAAGAKTGTGLEYHFFRLADSAYLYLIRSARLFKCDAEAARSVSLLGREGSTRRELVRDQASAELRKILQQEALLPPMPTAGVTETTIDNFSRASIYLAQSCNFACTYCWNQGGTFGTAPQVMSRGVADAVVHGLVRQIQASRSPVFSVAFYGGEPLLGFAALERIVLGLRAGLAGTGKRVAFSVDTNGWFLEGQRATFLARYFDHISVSLDGGQDAHDRTRPHRSGNGTWARIEGNIRGFEKPELISLRATLTADSDSYRRTFIALAALGIRRIDVQYAVGQFWKSVSERVAAVVGPQRQRAELEEFVSWYVPWLTAHTAGTPVPVVSNLLGRVRSLARGYRYTKPCEAGTGLFAIDCDGRVYPCISFAGSRYYTTGAVGDLPITAANGPLPLDFGVDRQESCRTCWARYDCGGGCFAYNEQMTGSTTTPLLAFCIATRGNMELYLHALSRISGECPWQLLEPDF
jgi:uncharacterized protein